MFLLFNRSLRSLHQLPRWLADGVVALRLSHNRLSADKPKGIMHQREYMELYRNKFLVAVLLSDRK